MSKKRAIIGVIIIAAIAIILLGVRNNGNRPGKLDAFAQCLKQRGAVFYGAFWCSHCQNQKALFGDSAQYIPYTECSTADGRGQLAVCQEKQIESYPTWVFPDGTKLTGEIPLNQLAQKSGCELPK